ncbi:MAG TPA: VWA domain-containing protein [Thiopseudomonas sp.]|nr:VWA domain-containing protein [Thiopseudomonas sp.]
MSAIIASWPQWTRVYWLLCVPLAALLLWSLYRTHQAQRDWHSFLPPAFHAILLNQNAPRQRHTRYLLLAAAWLLAILALLGPSWESTAEQSATEPQAAPLVIAIQLTTDMLANDLAPSRLHHIREKVLRILQQRDTAFTALVVYAGSAHTLVPLSNDLLTSSNLLQALQPDLMPVPGQRADLAVERGIRLLQQGAQGQGQILLISTGVSSSEQKAIRQHLQRTAIDLKIMGVGTTTGAPIALSTQSHFLTDAAGAVVISRLDQTSLQLLAKTTLSPYTDLRHDDSDLAALDLASLTDSNSTSALLRPAVEQRDQGYWLILPILILAATFARRGSLLLILVCLLPIPSFAMDWDDLWLRPDQQGAQLIEQQPALAAHYFIDPLWRASALYLAQDYQGAAELFADIDTPEAHYNRGNALALAGLLEQALLAYQQALDHAPEMLVAQYNKALVERSLAAAQHSTTDNTETVPTTPESVAHSADSLSTTTPEGSTLNNSHATHSQDNSQLISANVAVEAIQTDKQAPAQLDQDSPTATQPSEQSTESAIHFESWLEQIPDNPSELLRRKFLYEHTMQEVAP